MTAASEFTDKTIMCIPAVERGAWYAQHIQRLLRREARDLKEVVAEQTLELRLLKKSMIGDGGDLE